MWMLSIQISWRNYKSKTVGLFLFFAGISVAVTGQVVTSFCSANDSIVKLYKSDADKLTIRKTIATRNTYKDSVKISHEIQVEYLNALLAVYNATLLPAQDTITRLLNIHAYNPGLNSLIVFADSNVVWMHDLRNNRYPTRDYSINKMMKAYHLTTVFYSGLLQPSMVVFRTDTNSNLAPLAKKFRTFFGVKAAESDYLYGDGNDINDIIHEDYMELLYSYGWQACSTGCEQRRYWKFRIYSDCSVEYTGSYGSPLEPSLLLSVHENEELFHDIKIYPNPSKNKFYIECNDSKIQEVSLAVTNKKGDLVFSLDKLSRRQEVDLILLSNGIYYLKLQRNKEYKIYKIDKR